MDEDHGDLGQEEEEEEGGQGGQGSGYRVRIVESLENRKIISIYEVQSSFLDGPAAPYINPWSCKQV